MRLILLAVFTLIGCSSDTVTPDVGAALVPARQMLSAEPATLAARVSGNRILADTARGIVLFRNPEDEGTVVGAPMEVGELREVRQVDDTTILMGSNGAFVLRDTEFFRSPIGAALPEGETVVDIVATPRLAHPARDLWVLTETQLYLYRDEQLQRITVEGVSFGGGVMATAPLRRGRSVWFAVDGSIYEIYARDGELNAGRVVVEVPEITAMAADGSGVLWLVGGGQLMAFRKDRALVRFEVPFQATSFITSPLGPDLWVRADGGQLWHQLDGVFRPVEGVDAAATLLPGGDGELILAGASGVVSLRARHPLRLLGLEDGGRILAAVDVELDAPSLDQIASVVAHIDDEAVPLTENPWGIRIDPADVEFGAHELRVEVAYNDGTLNTQISSTFQVGVEATWADHIEPLFIARCAMCHAPGGSATTQLETKSAWVDTIDLILFDVREQRMPLGLEPLDRESISLIEAWSANGFPD